MKAKAWHPLVGEVDVELPESATDGRLYGLSISAVPDNTTHHWVPKYTTMRGEVVNTTFCVNCGIDYQGGVRNDETCPEAPK